jgi:hypothetical protein
MDKVGKNTGAGKVKLVEVEDKNIVANIDLYNYNVDGNLLKEEHKSFLKSEVVPMLKNFPLHVKLRGMASKSGDSKYNEQLSLERVLRVKKYLTDQGIPESKVPGSQMEAVGEYHSSSAQQEDEMDRSVRVVIARGVKNKPYPPAVPPMTRVPGSVSRMPGSVSLPTTHPLATNDRSKHWRIQFLGDGAISDGLAGLSGFVAGFRLHNLGNNTESLCMMGPFSLGVGTPGVTLKSDEWQTFTTNEAMRIQDFEGKAEYLSVAGLPHQSLGGMIYKIPAVANFLGTGLTYLSFFEKGIGPIPVKTGMAMNVTLINGTQAHFMCMAPQPYNDMRYKDYQNVVEVIEGNVNETLDVK